MKDFIKFLIFTGVVIILFLVLTGNTDKSHILNTINRQVTNNNDYSTNFIRFEAKLMDTNRFVGVIIYTNNGSIDKNLINKFNDNVPILVVTTPENIPKLIDLRKDKNIVFGVMLRNDYSTIEDIDKDIRNVLPSVSFLVVNNSISSSVISYADKYKLGIIMFKKNVNNTRIYYPVVNGVQVDVPIFVTNVFTYSNDVNIPVVKSKIIDLITSGNDFELVTFDVKLLNELGDEIPNTINMVVISNFNNVKFSLYDYYTTVKFVRIMNRIVSSTIKINYDSSNDSIIVYVKIPEWVKFTPLIINKRVKYTEQSMEVNGIIPVNDILTLKTYKIMSMDFNVDKTFIISEKPDKIVIYPLIDTKDVTIMIKYSH